MLSFEKMRVSTRLIVAGVAIFVGLLAISAYTLKQIRDDALAAHYLRLKDLVDVTSGIVANFQKLESEKKLSTEEAQLQAKEALRTPRFGSND